MQTVSEELCACRKELEAQTAAQKRAAQDREELAKAGAALDVRLNSADRKACGLTQELAALRFVCVYMCGLTSKRVGVRLESGRSKSPHKHQKEPDDCLFNSGPLRMRRYGHLF